MKSMKKHVRKVLIFVLCCVLFTAFTTAAIAAGQQNAAKKEKAQKAAVKKPAKKPAPSQNVMQIQQALTREGYKLKVDGLTGPKFRATLKKYQKANGLKATGKPDKGTLERLGIESM
ncbi:MAG: peptidoglycan-binding domain-containing protein [Desulfobacterales bacterium]|nr:peptidoglycan-binding domain-containing protein [Desulfobacterales bacterium]